MRLLKLALRHVHFLSFLFLIFCVNGASAQEKSNLPAAKNSPVVKGQSPAAQPSETQEQASPLSAALKADSPEQIRRRAEWFYKQRSSVKGHIPAGARLKAFQHMQRMMVAEGKLALRPDGSYAEVAPQSWLSPLSAVTSTWASIGPTPTTGGQLFSPVTGRVTTIAVDPSDPTGNTVLIGGAMGGIWRSTDAGAHWTAVGDQNASLAMGSIAFAPSNHSVVYAATGESESVAFDIYYGAGVLKSTDGGLHWTQTCTVASSTCPFIGPYDDITPFGFFTLGGTRITYIAVNPTNPQMVLVGAQTQFAQGPTEGVYCSDNGGTTWNKILPDQLSGFVGFASSTVAYAALGNPFGSSPNAPNGNGIYKATSIGSTCSTINFARLTTTTLPPQSSMGRIDLGIAPSDPTGNTVYASIADATTFSSNNLGVFVTTNGGTSWTQTAAPDICRFQCWFDNVIKVDPNNQNIVFFGGSSAIDSAGNPFWVVRTENGGTTWSSVIPNLPPGSAGLPHVDNHAIAFVKLLTGKVRMYLGNDGGIWRTDDAEGTSVSWTNLNNPSLTLSQFYPSISINPSSPSIAFGGTQDNSSQNYQGSISWADNQQCGDGGSTAVDTVIPSTVYIGCITGFPVNASYQNGALGSFFPAVNGINPNDFIGILPPLITDPSTGNTVYFGTTKVYQSVDAGNTWTPISNDLVSGANFDSLTVLAVAPANPSVVYAGANVGTSSGGLTGLVFVATNVSPGNFANFNQVSGQGSLPPRALTAIAIDPSDNTGKTAYVTFSGFSFVNAGFGVNDPIGHIFNTTDGGSTWKDVSCSVAVCTTPAASDLPNTPVNDLVVDPNLPGIIYAATDEGVFVGDCTATPCKWSVLTTGLPHVVVLSLRLHEPSRTLRAASHGRGAWDINLNNFSFTGPHISSLSPVSVNAGGASFTLTVNGSGLTNGTVQWNGSATNVTTTQVSDTKLTASIAASLLSSADTPKITVVNGTQTSNALTFAVLAGTPTLTSISPSSTPVQTNPTTPVQIQLTGTNFAASAKVLFNGAQNGITVAAPTASCPLPTCLTATLPAALLGPFGSTDDIAVINLPPGGGLSKPVTFKVAAPPPPNDNFANAINISTLTFNDVQDSSGATTESLDPVPACVPVSQIPGSNQFTGRSNTIWYKFTPVFSANLNVDTSGSSYDTVLSIWTGSAGSFVNVACNDDINPGIVLQSQLSNVPLTVGTTYYIMVSSFGPPDSNPIALGGRSQLNFSYNFGEFPAPTLSSISPTSATSGGSGFTLTVNGTGFLPGASVFFYNVQLSPTPEPTAFVSSTQLTAAIPASDIALPGNYTVSAQNPQPNFGFSNTISFTVNLGTYPVPTLNSIFPNSVLATTPVFIVNASGANFASSAVLNFNGVPQVTTVNTPASLSAQIAASQLTVANVGTVPVTITNPSPGGGTSSSLPFQITMPSVIPTVTSINPTSAPPNPQPPVTVTINGTNFLQGDTTFWTSNIPNETNFFIATTFISSTQLTIQPSFVNVPGTYSFYVHDPSGGFSNPVTFTVTPPPDFSITSSGTTSQTVNAGQNATFTNAISVTAQNGFASQVNLSCSLPIAATHTTCAVNPNMFASGSGTATVSVTTMARGLVPPSLPIVRFYLRPQLVPLLLLTILLAVLILRFARTRRQGLAGALPFAVFVVFLMLQAMGCGGGGYNPPPPPPPPTGTPVGTYTVTVTGTSGSTTHTTTLTLTVN
jgi:photosystem II stability/assembly factor-like uncharacterized protein